MMPIRGDQNVAIVTDNMVAEWGACANPQLSVMLVYLRFLALVHQTHHWTCKGDSFYGDHKLFMDLYEGITEEIDELAEKAVGLGNGECVNMTLQVSQLMKLISGHGMTSTIPQQNDLARASLQAEVNFIQVAEHLIASMEGSGAFDQRPAMTRGLDNLLAGILDKHEKFVYLLKARCGR